MNDQNTDPHVLDVFFEYEQLSAVSIGRFLSSLGSVSDLVVDSYARAFLVGPDKLPTLLIDAIDSSNSIKFTFGEGWLPSISSDKDNDIVVNVPRRLGVPLLCGYLLLTSASQVLNLRNDYLDSRIKEMEVQLKETELNAVLEQNNELLGQATERTADAVQAIIANRDYKSFIVQGVDLVAIRHREDERPLVQ